MMDRKLRWDRGIGTIGPSAVNGRSPQSGDAKMSEQQIPDVSDPDVRHMVLCNHRPEEVWSVAGLLFGIHCKTCFRPWPCPSIQAARKAREETAE